MKKTQLKILANAVSLFNQLGVGNVRLQDIAAGAGISAGNLSYHYKTKKDLMVAVLSYMQDAHEEMRSLNVNLFQQDDYTSITKNYLNFQIGHRFFYRDILEIKNLVPKAETIFEKQMKQVLEFTKNGMHLAVDKGYIIPEPHTDHYYYFAKNIWAILNSWLIEREVLGEKKLSMEQVMTAIWELHYPYLTAKGKKLFPKVKTQIPALLNV